MLISKQVQRLIDALRMRFEQLAPSAINWKAFYSMPSEEDGYVDAAKLLQRDDHITWPANPCLLFAIDPSVRTNDWRRQTVLGMIPHERGHINGQPFYLIELSFAWYSDSGQICIEPVRGFMVSKLSEWVKGAIGPPAAWREFGKYRLHCSGEDASYAERQLLRSFGNDPWCSFVTDLNGPTANMIRWDFPGLMMFFLASLASPTGYRIAVDSKHPVGTKARKRNPNANRLYTTIGWNRLYNLKARPDERIPLSDYIIRERRGHDRYLWKESGVLLERLPKGAKERAALADYLGVRRVPVKPHQCRFRYAEDEQYYYEVLSGGTNDGA